MLIGHNITIRPYRGRRPRISEKAHIFENVSIYGDVTICEGCVILPGCVIRSEYFPIVIGKNCILQDMVCLHDDCDGGGITIGENVAVGHRAIVHACTIHDNTLIGMGAVVQDKAVIGKNCLIGAGAVVPEGTAIRDGMVALGVPAKEKRAVTEKDISYIRITIEEYHTFAREYLEGGYEPIP
jgi:carbonic anhydrase/acetyltransferase-like protein (isoleucine patch superfamily)